MRPKLRLAIPIGVNYLRDLNLMGPTCYGALNLILGCVLCVFSFVDAGAAVGSVDSTNQFPFVVRLAVTGGDGSTWFCSGVLFGRVVGTAAHCVWNSEDGPSHGWARSVTVEYDDLDGNRKKITSRAFRVPEGYIPAAVAWRATKSNPASGGDQDLRFHQQVLHDMAYVIIDDHPPMPYLHWGTELSGGRFDSLPGCGESPQCVSYDVTGRLKEDFLQKIQRELGDLKQVRAVVVGYGNYICDDFSSREENCKSDGQRRFVEVPLIPTVVADGQSFSAPWIWCTGQTVMNVNPVQHGDSGGPLFVQTVDGRWIFVGYTSGGSVSKSCASSMFNDLNTWRDVFNSEAYRKSAQSQSDTGLPQRLKLNRENAERFLYEWLASWSSPNEAALSRLKSLYRGGLFVPSKVMWAYQGQKVSFDQIYQDKKSFAERWPERSYVVQPGSSISVFCNGGQPPYYEDFTDYCSISATVVWDVRSEERSARSTGVAELNLKIHPADWFALPLFTGDTVPTIISEDQKVISRKISVQPNLLSLGLKVSPLTSDLRSRYSIPVDVSGLVVINVAAGSPAAEQQLSVGDVIISLESGDAEDADEFASHIDQLRKDGRSRALLLVTTCQPSGCHSSSQPRFVSVKLK